MDGLAVFLCRVGGKTFHVPAYHVLEGTEARYPGQRGVMVLPRWFVRNLGLSDDGR